MQTEERKRMDRAIGMLGTAMARRMPERDVLDAFHKLELAVPETSGVFFELDPDGVILLSHFGLVGNGAEACAARNRLEQKAAGMGLEALVQRVGSGPSEGLYLQALPKVPNVGQAALQELVYGLDEEESPDAEPDGMPAPGL